MTYIRHYALLQCHYMKLCIFTTPCSSISDVYASLYAFTIHAIIRYPAFREVTYMRYYTFLAVFVQFRSVAFMLEFITWVGKLYISLFNVILGSSKLLLIGFWTSWKDDSEDINKMTGFWRGAILKFQAMISLKLTVVLLWFSGILVK